MVSNDSKIRATVLLTYLMTTTVLHMLAQIGVFSRRVRLLLPFMIFQVLRMDFVLFSVPFLGISPLVLLLLVPWTWTTLLVRSAAQ